MYTEEVKRKINWSNIIKKGLLIFLVILIIFLIIWLFTRNTENKKQSVNFDDSNNSTITNKDAYTNEFITGYSYFHDTVKDYLLTKVTLPTNGNSIKYTLKELTDKGIILPFIYQDGETCDLEGSYVTVTNNNGKYDMTVMLVCGKEVAKTTEELGCNQLCVSGKCDVVVAPNEPDDELAYEYQFKQAYKTTETVYRCPAGYTQNGNLCVKDNKTTTNAIKKTTYTCPAGYEKVGLGSSTKCVKPDNKEIKPTVTTTYSCEAGYTKTGDGENTVCTKEVNANKTTNYSCPSGYTKTGSGANTKCVKTTSNNITPTYSCPSGYTKTGSGANTKCTKNNTESIEPSYGCPNGYTLNMNGANSTCTKSEDKVVTGYNYYCSSGSLSGTKCNIYVGERYYTFYESHGSSYNGCKLSGKSTAGCKNGICSQTIWTYKCDAYSYSVDASRNAVYGCTSGTPSGNSCITTINATVSCSKGTLSGNTCVYNTTDTKEPTISCSKGTLSSDKTKCVYNTNETKNPTVTDKYSCTNGVLNGTKCVITDNSKIVKDTKTTCPSGYSKNGDMCISKGTDYKDYTIKTEYFCKSGYTMYGEGASAVCTKGETVKVNAEKETKEVTKYRYKWSTETYLEGWERTGKSRQTKISSK